MPKLVSAPPSSSALLSPMTLLSFEVLRRASAGSDQSFFAAYGGLHGPDPLVLLQPFQTRVCAALFASHFQLLSFYPHETLIFGQPSKTRGA